MDKIRITAHQKRLLEWSELLHSAQIPEELRRDFSDTLKTFRNHLARVWEQAELGSGNIEHLDLAKLRDLERQLESFNEQARVNLVPRGGVVVKN